MSVRVFVEDAQAARLRRWCWRLLIAPFGVFLAVEVGSRMLTAGPADSGSFVPTPLLLLLGALALAAAVYAGVFTFLLRRLRQFLTEDFLYRRRGRSIGRQGPWLTGGMLFALLAMLAPQVLGGSINRLVGDVVCETWRVQAKDNNQTRNACQYRVAVESSANAARVCVTRERWERLRVDDSFPIVAVFSALGHQVLPAPDVLAKGGDR
ncbi:MAG: hypothetical protein ABIR54_11855 [Burkholderiaceae bacterium]